MNRRIMDRRGFLATIGLGTFLINTTEYKEISTNLKLEEYDVEVVVNLRHGNKAFYKDELNRLVNSNAIVEDNLTYNIEQLLTLHTTNYGHPPKYLYMDAFVQLSNTQIGTITISIKWGCIASDLKLEYLFSEEQNV